MAAELPTSSFSATTRTDEKARSAPISGPSARTGPTGAGSYARMSMSRKTPMAGTRWAPDGRRLVYAAFDPNALAIVNVADGAKRILRGTRHVGARQPDWSPNGRLIAFLRQRAPFGGSEIYVVAPDGTGLRRLVGTRSDLQTPRWSPDGRSIAYFHLINGSPGEERWAVVVADADGRRPRRLGITHTWDWLDWSPDSKGVAWVDSFNVFVAYTDGRTRPRLVAKGETPDWG